MTGFTESLYNQHLRPNGHKVYQYTCLSRS